MFVAKAFDAQALADTAGIAQGGLVRNIGRGQGLMAATEELPHGTLVVLDPQEAKAIVDRGGAVLVDVRNPDEYEMAHIPGSLHHPLKELDPAALVKASAKPVIFLCAVGVRSKIAADRMLAAGYQPVAHLEGGISAWLDAGLPVTSEADAA